MLNKPHKFFDTYLDNNLDSLKDFLIKIENQIINDNILDISQDVLNKYNKVPGAITKIGMKHYNIFTFLNPEIYNLYIALKELTKNACDYYNLDFKKEKYLIHGWFNLDNKSNKNEVNPIDNPHHFHDHFGGQGAPHFHGYYCVDAEPSSTYYAISKNENNIFENINKNNRAIISETGHPHGRGDWFENRPRITIAYDIIPSSSLTGAENGKWIPLI